MAEWYYQREANVLGADYFERQGWHPPKEKMSKDEKKDEMQEVASVLAYQRTIGVDNRITELEKENKLLGERCNQLLKDKGELTDKIEKMKCCGNCIHRHCWGNELGCNLDLDKQFECDNTNKKYWEFSEV